MDNQQPGSGVPNDVSKAPLLRVNVGACDVTYVKPDEKPGRLAEAKEILTRYGRFDVVDQITQFENTVKLQGLDLAQVPMVLMTTIDDTADVNAITYTNGPSAVRVEAVVDGAPMQLKPEIVHFDGLDASKEVSESDPRRYLVLPYQPRVGDARGGVMIPTEAFDKWVAGIPRQ